MHDALVQVDVGNSDVQTLLQSMDATVSIAAVCTEKAAWEQDVAILAVVGHIVGNAPSQEVVISAYADVLKFEDFFVSL